MAADADRYAPPVGIILVGRMAGRAADAVIGTQVCIVEKLLAERDALLRQCMRIGMISGFSLRDEYAQHDTAQ